MVKGRAEGMAEDMVVNIAVNVKCNDMFCSSECPYFRLEMGASFEKPIVEYCRLFNTDLSLADNRKDVLRCSECCSRESNWSTTLHRANLEQKCHGKKAALKLLRDTNYAIDIWEYDSIPEMLTALLDSRLVTRAYLEDLLNINGEHLDSLLKGQSYPYLIKPLQEALDFPRLRPLSHVEMTMQRAYSLRRSDR